MNNIWGVMMLAGMVWGMASGRADAVSEAVLASAKEAVALCITMLGVMGLWTGLMEIAKEAGLIQALCVKIHPLIRFLFPRIPKHHPANEPITLNCAANFLGLGWAATPAGLRAMEELAKLEEERRERAGSKEGGRINGSGSKAGSWINGSGSKEGSRIIGSRSKEGSRIIGSGSKEGSRIRAGKKASRVMPPGTASNEMCTFLILNISSLQLIPVNVIAWRAQYGSVNPAAIVGPGIVATAVSTAAAVIFCKVMDRSNGGCG